MLYKHNKKNLFLEITQDETQPISPREDSNLGYFITLERSYNSPDNNETLKNIIDSTQYEVSNTQEHIEAIKEAYEAETDEKVKAIFPVNKYEHGGVVYSLGEKHGFDHSNCGFYIITDKTQKELGTRKKDFKKVIEQEIDNYNKWANGEIYQARLYKQKICKCCNHKTEEMLDSICGLYDENEVYDHFDINEEDFKLINSNL